MVKICSGFHTKPAKKPYPPGAGHNYIAYIREYPGSLSVGSLSSKNGSEDVPSSSHTSTSKTTAYSTSNWLPVFGVVGGIIWSIWRRCGISCSVTDPLFSLKIVKRASEE